MPHRAIDTRWCEEELSLREQSLTSLAESTFDGLIGVMNLSEFEKARFRPEVVQFVLAIESPTCYTGRESTPDQALDTAFGAACKLVTLVRQNSPTDGRYRDSGIFAQAS